MRNRLLASLMILAVLAGFTSCQDQSTAEDMTRTVSLALSNVEAAGSRTLRPDAVVQADTYYVSLTEMSGTNGSYSEVEGSENNKTEVKATIGSSEGKTTLTIDSVHIGMYRVDIYGTNNGTKVLTGTSGDNVLTVAPNGDNIISITMNQIYNEEGLKGTVEVPIDWSTATSTRVTNGFQIKAFDATKGGDPIATYTYTYTYTPGTDEKTSDTWTFEMGVTPSTLLRFDLYDADGAFINTLRRTYVWVASGTTSILMDGEKGLTITNMTTQYAFNIYNFKATENTENSANLSWNIAGVNNIKQINIWYTTKTERPSTDANLVIKEGLKKEMTYTLEGLETGDTYHVWYQAVYNNGMVSTIDKYDGTIRTVSYVTAIDITNADIETKVDAAPFTLSVSITPEGATNKTYTYSYTNGAFTVSGDTFTPAKAGVYTITATANGSREDTTVSDTIQVTTHLATPTVTATATAQGIQLSGYADEDAESYDIYRNGSFLKNTEDTNYVDSDVATSTKYSYEVVAKLTSGSTNLDSDKSTATKEISIKNSVINITVANIESSMDIDISTSGQIYLQSGVANSSVTFSYEAPSGYTTAWLLNGTAIAADEGSNNSRVTISLEKYENEFFSAEQTLTIVLTDGNGKSYSNGINFYYVLGNSTVTAISLSVDNDLIITNVSDKSARQIQINAAVSGTGAYINVPNYSIVEGSNIASINSKGVVTFNEGASGTVKVRATGIPTTTVTDEITLYAFSSADDMATALVNSVNTVWGKAFAIADDSSHFNKDWFVYGGSGARDSYDINATDIGGTSGSFYFRNASSVLVDPSNYPEARIDSVTADISKFGSATLSSETISLDISTVSGTGPSGTSNMVLVGRTTTNKVTIVLSNHNSASATINYNSVHVNNKTGDYTVAIPANVAVNQSSAISTTINNSSSITQVLTN